MNLFKRALDFIFPPVCGICGKVGKEYLCPKCQKELLESSIFLNKIESYNHEKDNPIKEHFYLFSYSGIIREKILQYKFQNKPYLSNTISEFFIKNEKVCGFLKKYDIISVVPISKQRKKQRGYNQSELIARKIGKTGLIHFENRNTYKSN